METRSSYVLIGAFTLAVFVLGLGFALWLGKSTLDREWDHYDIVFTESVSGLTVGGAVQYGGIQVGEVRKLSLDPRDPRRVIAQVRVAGGTPIREGTRAKLTLTGLTGVSVIQLVAGDPRAPPLAARGGQPRPVILADPSALAKLLASSEGIATSVNEVLIRIGAVLKPENIARVDATLANLERVSGTLAEHDADMGRALADLSDASRALKQTLERSGGLMDRLERIAAEAEPLLRDDARATLAETREALVAARRAVERADAMLAENRANLADFSGEGLAQVGPAVTELRTAIAELRRVAARVENDPGGLLRAGPKPREYEPR